MPKVYGIYKLIIVKYHFVIYSGNYVGELELQQNNSLNRRNYLLGPTIYHTGIFGLVLVHYNQHVFENVLSLAYIPVDCGPTTLRKYQTLQIYRIFHMCVAFLCSHPHKVKNQDQCPTSHWDFGDIGQ